VVDINHRLDFVPKDFGQSAARRAVLCPILRRPLNISDDETIGLVRRLQGIWRRRVVELRDAGWRAADRLNFQYLRNCPPTMAASRQISSRPCSTNICPFCWARNATELARLVYRASTALATPPHLVEVRWRNAVACEDDDESFLLDLMQGSIRARRRRMRSFRALGAFVSFTVAPQQMVVTQRQPHWSMVQRYLLVVEPGWQTPRVAGIDNADVTRHSRATKAAIATAVGRTLRYPRDFLFGDAARVVQIEEARRLGSPRTSAHFGCLRGAVPEEPAASPDA